MHMKCGLLSETVDNIKIIKMVPRTAGPWHLFVVIVNEYKIIFECNGSGRELFQCLVVVNLITPKCLPEGSSGKTLVFIPEFITTL